MKELADSASRILTERLVWENKQRLYYRMRHDGLPRLNKPFQTAADSHYPEIDLAIRKLKPFWMGQITAGDRLCVFTSMKEQVETITEAAADYLHFTLCNRTEFLRKMRVLIDTMMLTGRGIMKAVVDPTDGYALKFESINPLFILMPQEANTFEDADEFVHVRQFTVEAYKRLDDRYCKDAETISKIRGSKDWQSLGIYNQDVRLQEGISFTRQQNQIILFEHYTKTASGWTVNTYCPMSPDTPVRKAYTMPYKVNGKPSLPFFSFQMEVKNEGWYSPRGLGELLAAVEQYMTKLWNEKADAMTFANRPLYTGEKEIVNSANYRWQPGEYIPGNIRGVQQGPFPFDFDREIMFARGIGEQLAQAPDFGIVDTTGAATGGKARTATENNRIGALQAAGGNDNAQMFREDLSKLYRHVWGLICQFKEREFTFYAAQSVNTLPQEALHDSYIITPDGSPDGWNRMARFQKAIGAVQTFAGNPNVDAEVLTKEALNAYDARLAIKAFVPTNLKGASEYEDEAMIINSLLAPGSGKPPFPATVAPSQDHVTRLKALIEWIHACGVIGTPVDPMARQRVHERIGAHLQILQKQNPAASKQVKEMLMQMEQATAQPIPMQPQPGGPPMMPQQPQSPQL